MTRKDTIMVRGESFVKKAAAKVLAPGEDFVAIIMANLPGTLKREGRYMMARGLTGISIIQVAADGGLPPKMYATVTGRRILLFEQSMLGRAKQLSAEIELEQVLAARITGASRAQVSIKVQSFEIDLRDGSTLELESADAKGLQLLVGAINSRAGGSSSRE
jgi:hypothetical protein